MSALRQPTPPQDEPDVIELTPDEAMALFDQEARRLMGLSGEEFLRRLDAGEFPSGPDVPEDRNYNGVILMLPFAGRLFS